MAQKDQLVAALLEERRGLAVRAEAGDENAARRVGEVDDQLERLGAGQERKADAKERADTAGEKAAEQKPTGRSARSRSTT